MDWKITPRESSGAMNISGRVCKRDTRRVLSQDERDDPRTPYASSADSGDHRLGGSLGR